VAQAREWAALLAVSAALAFGFERTGFPAALLLGPMLAGILFGVRGSTLRMPPLGFAFAQAIVGLLVASTITAPIVVQVAQAWLPMLFVVATTVIAGALVGWVLTKAQVLPGSTAAWGSSAGAAAAMVAMADEFGADSRLVAFMQYLRLVLVVIAASAVSRVLIGHARPLATAHPQQTGVAGVLAVAATLAIAGGGAFIALRLRLPAGALLGPMLIGALLHASGLAQIALPPALLAIAYAALGWYVGLRFSRG
jgi:membrane AbrB-like protein